MKLTFFFRSLINRLSSKEAEQKVQEILELAQVLENEHRFQEALAQYEEAIRLKSSLARAHLLKGNLLARMEKHEEAKAVYESAIACDADYAAAYYNLGDTCYQLGLHDQALQHLRMALLKKPDFIDAEITMGSIFHDLKKIDAAIACYQRALVVQPDHFGAHQNLACVLRESMRLEEAVEHYQAALASNPHLPGALYDLGHVLHELCRYDEATEIFRRALMIRPDSNVIHDYLLFACCHNPAITPEVLFSEHCRFGDQFKKNSIKHLPQHSNTKDPERRLRIGLLSTDFKRHAMANFIEPLVRQLVTHDDVELHAYFGANSDDRTERFTQIIQHWHPTAQLSDDALEQKIREDGIDILIDACGHSAGNRLTCLARKPAPIQVGWLGYLGTSGLSAMDYYLCDPYFLPHADFACQFTEKLVYLPATGAFLPEEDRPTVNRLPALKNGYITFGSFNRYNKLGREVIALWSELLKEVPEARMLLGAMSESSQKRITEAFADEGIAAERLRFYPEVPMTDYLGLYHQVDLCLDTFPFAGGTTLMHGVTMGVPTLTIAGRTPPGRFGASLLAHLGLADQFVATDTVDFIEKCKHWAHSLDALEEIRSNMRQRFQDSILNQPGYIATSWVIASRIMWKRWCDELPVKNIDISRHNNGR